MSLLDAARSDCDSILGDTDTGFSMLVRLTAPDGYSNQIAAFSNDISQMIDPGTGEVISGRQSSITMTMKELYGSGFESLPKGTESALQKPWTVEIPSKFADPLIFLVVRSNPDATIRQVTCWLGRYND